MDEQITVALSEADQTFLDALLKLLAEHESRVSHARQYPLMARIMGAMAGVSGADLEQSNYVALREIGLGYRIAAQQAALFGEPAGNA